MARVPIKVTVNGVEHNEEIEPRLLLVHFLRENLRLTGTHIGCDTSHCGACTVVLDGRAVKSCTVFGVQADGRSITTVEGLEQDGKLHPLQDGFYQEHGLQCGFCTPGMLMTGIAFLEQGHSGQNPHVHVLLRAPRTNHNLNFEQTALSAFQGASDLGQRGLGPAPIAPGARLHLQPFGDNHGDCIKASSYLSKEFGKRSNTTVGWIFLDDLTSASWRT